MKKLSYIATLPLLAAALSVAADDSKETKSAPVNYIDEVVWVVGYTSLRHRGDAPAGGSGECRLGW